MKKLMIGILIFASLSSFAAVNLSCKHLSPGLTEDIHYGVLGHALLDCTDKNDKKYAVVFRGVGLGFRHSSDGFIGLSCPTVSLKRLNTNGRVNLGSVRVAASLGGGASAAVAINHRGGTCLMGGLELGVGASASLGELSIMKGDAKDFESMLFDIQ
jgi:hypothetical protein